MNPISFFNQSLVSTTNKTSKISQHTQISEYEKIAFVATTIFFFCFCIYFVLVLLTVYFNTPHVRESARYILFAHMLINDIIHLSLGLYLCVGCLYFISIPVPICYILVTCASVTFRITPLNLACMALERYVAVCFPFRHIILCTAQRSHFAIATMWFVGFLPNATEFIVLILSVDKKFFSQYVVCKQQTLSVIPAQSTIQSLSFNGSLILVSAVILFSYVKVMLIAQETGSGKSAASKAARTLILHAVQLLLCLISLTYAFSETYIGDYFFVVRILNFWLLMCLPRLLSPLIYGIRDSVFSKSIKKMYSTR